MLLLTTPHTHAPAKTPVPALLITRVVKDPLGAPGIQMVVKPDRPFIEKRQGQQFVNFDLLIQNQGPQTYNLVAIKLFVFDRSGQLELQRELNENGKPPALDMVGERQLPPGNVIDVFQPFYAFGPEIELGRMRLECLLEEKGHTAPPAAFSADATVSVEVRPRLYTPVAFSLPLQGLILVHDGHDFYSHHRRYNLTARYQADPASAVSANLYAYVLMRITPAGLLFRRDPHRKENWLTYGEPIFAPAPGQVIQVVAGVQENTFTATGEAKSPAEMETKDPLGLGDYVSLQHADGRVSWLLHMQPHSSPVHVGDRVGTGQFLGRVGFSGDSMFPHLHYNVTDGPAYPSQGVPSCFERFVRVLGSRRVPVTKGQVDTGDLLEERNLAW